LFYGVFLVSYTPLLDIYVYWRTTSALLLLLLLKQQAGF